MINSSRRWTIQYTLLTLLIFLPLLWSFRYVRNLYPFAAWNVMTGADISRGRSYFMLRGETVAGQTIDIPAIKLTDTMAGRNWSMVTATFDNQAFKLSSLHPANAAELVRVGGIEHLPPGDRLPELLAAWGKIYNDRQPANSSQRLKAIRLDLQYWDGGNHSDSDKLIETWRREL